MTILQEIQKIRKIGKIYYKTYIKIILKENLENLETDFSKNNVKILIGFIMMKYIRNL